MELLGAYSQIQQPTALPLRTDESKRVSPAVTPVMKALQVESNKQEVLISSHLDQREEKELSQEDNPGTAELQVEGQMSVAPSAQGEQNSSSRFSLFSSSQTSASFYDDLLKKIYHHLNAWIGNERLRNELELFALRGFYGTAKATDQYQFVPGLNR